MRSSSSQHIALDKMVDAMETTLSARLGRRPRRLSIETSSEPFSEPSSLSGFRLVFAFQGRDGVDSSDDVIISSRRREQESRAQGRRPIR